MYNINKHALKVIFSMVLNGTKSQNPDMEKWYNNIITELILSQEKHAGGTEYVR